MSTFNEAGLPGVFDRFHHVDTVWKLEPVQEDHGQIQKILRFPSVQLKIDLKDREPVSFHLKTI
jgi:hypothetical protein